jgi:hypothetical protein
MTKIMTNISRRVAIIVLALTLASAMALSSVTTAFAYDPNNPYTYDTWLYQTGTTNPSMGDGALVGAEYDGTKLTIYVTTLSAYGTTGDVIGIALDLDGDGVYETVGTPIYDGDGNIIGFEFESDLITVPLGPVSALFSIQLGTGTHPVIPAIGDLVIS